MELKDITPVVIGIPLLVLSVLTEGTVLYAALAAFVIFVAADLAWLYLKISDLNRLTVARDFSHRDIGLGSGVTVTTTFGHKGRLWQLLKYRQPGIEGAVMGGSQEGQVSITPGKEAAFTYELTPLKSGEFAISPVDIAIESLFFRCRLVKGSAEKVTAHLTAGTIAGHAQFSVGGDRRFSDMVSSFRATVRGGTDFSTVRFYVPGDETRHIDWARSSRANNLIVKEFERDQSQPVFFLIDADPSMGQGERPDLSFALDVAIPLVNKLAVENGRFGIARFSSTDVVDYLPLGMGREHTAKSLTIFSSGAREGDSRLVKGDVPLHDANNLRAVLKQAQGLGVLGSLMDETLREYAANIREGGFTRAIMKFCASSKTACQIVVITNVSMGLGSLLNGIRVAMYYGHSVIVVLTPHIWYGMNELIDPEKSYEKYAEVKNSISKIRGYGHVTVIDLGSGETGAKAALRGSQGIRVAR